MNELEKNKGRFYDKKVVEACKKIVQEEKIKINN